MLRLDRFKPTRRFVDVLFGKINRPEFVRGERVAVRRFTLQIFLGRDDSAPKSTQLFGRVRVAVRGVRDFIAPKRGLFQVLRNAEPLFVKRNENERGVAASEFGGF